jgi:uncharacterized protein (TIGR03118 family)
MVVVVPLLALSACGGPDGSQEDGLAALVGGAAGQSSQGSGRQRVYVQRNLVSSGGVEAERTDSHLVNAWGLDALAASPWWVADNGTSLSTLYDGEGVPQPAASPLVVSVPGAGAGAKPTGLVANPTSEFVITMGGATGPARFLFAGEDGTVSAWMRTDPPTTSAVKVADASAAGAIFKGLALASTPAGARLYATDFHNGAVRVWDGAFHEVPLHRGAFRDDRIPAGFAPFGIRAMRGVVLVTYAKQDEDAEDDVKGPGLGFVDAYSWSGRLLARIASGAKLNAPWGMALAPADFGALSGRLLVGNFGDGRIVSYRLRRGVGHPGDERGHDLADAGVYLQSADGPIEIDGLWALSFGTGAVAGPANALFFTAGPDDENEGLFGRIDPAP